MNGSTRFEGVPAVSFRTSSFLTSFNSSRLASSLGLFSSWETAPRREGRLVRQTGKQPAGLGLRNLERENQINRVSRHPRHPGLPGWRAVRTKRDSTTRLPENKCNCLMFTIEQFDGPDEAVSVW